MIDMAGYRSVTDQVAEAVAEDNRQMDDIVNTIDSGKSIIRALGTEVYLLAKAADPTLTPAQFKQRLRDRISGY